MAKISAGGARKLYHVDTVFHAARTRFTVCSDGRVLRQFLNDDGTTASGHTLYARGYKGSGDMLRAYLRGIGYEVQS